MKPELKDIYLLSDSGVKLPILEILNDGGVFFKLETKSEPARELEPKCPRFCGATATLNDGRRTEFVVNTETGEVVAYVIIPDGYTTPLLSDALSTYSKT